MENNAGVGLGDAGVLSLLSRIGPYGGGGYGGGYGGGGYGGGARDSFASTGSNAVRSDRNADVNREQHENILRGQAELSGQLRDQSLNARFNAQDIRLCEIQTQLSLCCCENKTAIAASEARLTGLIKDTTIDQLKDALAQERAGNSNGHGRGRGVAE